MFVRKCPLIVITTSIWIKIPSIWIIYLLTHLKVVRIGNVKLRQEVVNIWIFVFPAKVDSTDWEPSTKKLVQITLTWCSQQLLNYWLIFLSRSIMRAKIQIFFTLAEGWYCQLTAFLNPYDFNLWTKFGISSRSIVASGIPCCSVHTCCYTGVPTIMALSCSF